MKFMGFFKLFILSLISLLCITSQAYPFTIFCTDDFGNTKIETINDCLKKGVRQCESKSKRDLHGAKCFDKIFISNIFPSPRFDSSKFKLAINFINFLSHKNDIPVTIKNFNSFLKYNLLSPHNSPILNLRTVVILV